MKGFVAVSYSDYHVLTISRHIGDRGRLYSTLVSIADRVFWVGPVLSPISYVRVVRTWRGRAAAAGCVGPGRAVPKRGILTPTQILHNKDVCVCDMLCCIPTVHCCGMPHASYSSSCYISPASPALVVLLQAATAHGELLFGDPVDFSCLWLIDVRPLMRVSTPGSYLLVALLLYTVNPSKLLHFRPWPLITVFKY